MSSLFQYKIKTFWKQQTKLQTANSGSMYFRTFFLYFRDQNGNFLCERRGLHNSEMPTAL